MSNTYDPSERAKQKRLVRERDDARLRNGEVTPEELRKENSFFASVDLSEAIIVRKRYKLI